MSIARRTAVVAALALVSLSAPAAAHAGSLRVAQGPVSVPFWLVALTGGGVVGASFLLTSLVTDHDLIRAVTGWRLAVAGRAWPVAVRLGRPAGVAVLGLVVLGGAVGASTPTESLAVLVVWVGWWAGYAMSVYLLGNTWPALNPWRTLAGYLPEASPRGLPAMAGWFSVAGLLGLVWVEVVSPVAEEPRVLAGVVVAYSVVTLVGAAAYGVDPWFEAVDPVARVFRWYGRVAPLQRSATGVTLGLPGAGLARARSPDLAETGFVVALLWVTTYDGLVATPLWGDVVGSVVDAGLPPRAVYLLGIVGGYVVFFAAFDAAARLSRRVADTYVTAAEIRTRFAPALVPIAAGYHLAHFLGYFLSLSPALWAALVDPFRGAAAPVVLVLPDWFGALELTFVVLGHLLGVWVAHAVAFDLFTGRIQPIRSQYPYIVVMLLYTATSMWIVAQPYAAPPYL